MQFPPNTTVNVGLGGTGKKGWNSMPRTLRDPIERNRRRAMLTLPHIRPLANYAASLRRSGVEVPNFDPMDGGIAAQALFLMEKPGPMTAGDAGSGFISRDNDDATAETIARFMREAVIPREKIVIWNVIPWWNGTTQIVASELREGRAELPNLRALLPRLRVIVLVGRRAQRAAPCLGGYALLESAHPALQVRNTKPDRWNAIPKQWAAVHTSLD
jgi:hypothetical protein